VEKSHTGSFIGDGMAWELADPIADVEAIVELADSNYGGEVGGIINRSRDVFRHRVTVAATEQVFNRYREFLAVYKDLGESIWTEHGGFVDIRRGPDKLLGFCWFDRGGYTTYSNEEISNAKFHSVDLSLPAKQRLRLVHEMIDQHILWANQCGIPIICSTSIRADQGTFMRVHAKRGFSVNGSYAWIRTEKAMELLNDKG
jgi:hypothetical protein